MICYENVMNVVLFLKKIFTVPLFLIVVSSSVIFYFDL